MFQISSRKTAIDVTCLQPFVKSRHGLRRCQFWQIAREPVSEHICIRTNRHTCIHLHTCTYTCTETDRKSDRPTDGRTDIHTYTHIYIRTYIHTCMHTTYMHAYMYTYIHTYIHTYINTYIHTYIHTYVRTFIYLFIPAISLAPLPVHYYSEALPTQHGCCVGVSRRSTTGKCE